MKKKTVKTIFHVGVGNFHRAHQAFNIVNFMLFDIV
jgi:mannitol-1-phosphate/altronate dehydrogenase